MLKMQQLRRVENLRDQARRIIRSGIVSGQIEAGEIYSAVSLAEQLGVSATPVREALIDLANDGLVEPVRNRGFRVIQMSEQDLDELMDLRLLLEVPPLARINGKIDDATRERLEQTIRTTEKAAARTDIVEFLAADRAFHLGLLELTGNQRLVDLVARLRDQTRLRALGSMQGALLAETAVEHAAILDALCQGDADRAQALMAAHIKHSRGVWAGKPEPPAA